MATKNANVSARIEPEIKIAAEEVLEKLGLPVSVVIDSLYRQIIMTQGIPFSLTIPQTVPMLDRMSKTEFNNMMRKGLVEAKLGQGLDLNEAFEKISRNI